MRKQGRTLHGCHKNEHEESLHEMIRIILAHVSMRAGRVGHLQFAEYHGIIACLPFHRTSDGARPTMEGDDDWVSTSPIKLAVPPARRAFTPGRVLSREELRQQRRRCAAPAADHPKESVLIFVDFAGAVLWYGQDSTADTRPGCCVPRTRSRLISSRSLFEQDASQRISAFRPGAQGTAAATATYAGHASLQDSSTAQSQSQGSYSPRAGHQLPAEYNPSIIEPSKFGIQSP